MGTDELAVPEQWPGSPLFPFPTTGRLSGLLPACVIGADSEYLSVKYPGLGIEISVEIFIDRHGVDLPGYRRPIAGMHLQMPLRRHVSCEPHAERVKLRKTIGNGQCRRLSIILAFYRTGSASRSEGVCAFR